MFDNIDPQVQVALLGLFGTVLLWVLSRIEKRQSPVKKAAEKAKSLIDEAEERAERANKRVDDLTERVEQMEARERKRHRYALRHSIWDNEVYVKVREIDPTISEPPPLWGES